MPGTSNSDRPRLPSRQEAEGHRAMQLYHFRRAAISDHTLGAAGPGRIEKAEHAAHR